MNQREAKRLVCKMASNVLARSGGGGPPEAYLDETDADQLRICAAWEELVQELFERGEGNDQHRRRSDGQRLRQDRVDHPGFR